LLGVLWVLRKKIGRSPLTAVLLFAGSIFPALGFFNIYYMRFSLVADHFLYLASTGILLISVAGLAKLTGKKFPAFAIILILGLGHLTWKQIPIYKNNFALWSDTVQKNPNAWMAHYNLGNIFIAQQKHEEAISHYQQTIRIKPDFSLAPFNLGNALFAQKKTPEAIVQYQSAIRIKQDFVNAYNNLGVALFTEGKTEESIIQFRKAIKLQPDYVDARNNLEIVLISNRNKGP
jgi:tetratricopeptide (TPR) repeat protein